MRTEIKAERMPVRCASCHDSLASAPVSRCPECDTPGHTECLSEIGCGSFGCFGALADPTDNPLLELWDGEQDTDGDRYITIPHTSTGWPSDPDAVDTANRIAIDAEHDSEVCHCETLGQRCDCAPDPDSYGRCDWLCERHGSYVALILSEPCGCGYGDPWDCESRAVEILAALANYPLLCEEIHSMVEMEEQRQAVEEWGLSETFDRLEEYEREALDDAEDQMGSEAYDAACLGAYWDAARESGDYPEGSGGNLCLPDSDGFLDAFREALGLDAVEECEECEECEESPVSEADDGLCMWCRALQSREPFDVEYHADRIGLRQGYRYREHFAVYPTDKTRTRWGLDHIPTGFRIPAGIGWVAVFASRGSAEARADELIWNNQDLDWSSADPKTYRGLDGS